MKPTRRAPLWRAAYERLGEFEPPPRLRRLLGLAGYPIFGLLVALIAFASAIPRDKVRDRLETLLSQDPTGAQPMGLGVDVKAGELSVSLLSRSITADNVVLRTRPLRSTDKPARYVLDKVEIGVGLLGLAFQRPTYAFTIDAFEGRLKGAVRVTATDNHYDIEGQKLALGAVQGLQTAIGLPIEGKVEGKLTLDAPGRLLANSSGSLEITIDNCAIGDGKAKLAIPNDPFLAQGVTIPRIRLGKVFIQITIEKGKARFESMRAHSQDGDLSLEGYLDLRDPFPMSQMHGFLRFKLNDALVKREASLELLTNSLAGLGKRPDGFIGAQLTGSLSSLAFLANKNPPQGVTTKAESTPAPPPAVPSTPAPATAPGGVPTATPTAVVPPPPSGGDTPPTPIEIPPPQPSAAPPQPQPKDGVVPAPTPMRSPTRVEPEPAAPVAE